MSHTELKRVADLLERVRNESATSVDIETPGKGRSLITSIAFTIDSGKRAFAIPLAGSYFKPDTEKQLWFDHVKPTLESVPIVGQNFMYDWTILWDNGIKDMRLHWDTMVAQHLLFTEFPRSLEAMVSLYTDRHHHKHMMSEDLYAYNAFDVITTWDVMVAQKQRMADEDLKCMTELMLLHPPLIQMEKRGIKVDMSHKSEALADMLKEQEQYEQQLNEIADRPLKPRSSQDLQKYFYDEKKLKKYYNKTTGNPRVDEDALQKIAQKGYKEAELILKARKISKLTSTYFNMKIDKDERLRCQIKLTGTVTGRLATSQTPQGTGGNLQNIPPLFGYCLVPDDGYIFIEADLEQAEKRIVALITGDKKDIEEFKAGVDIHTRRAAEVLGKPESEVTKEERDKLGKPLNHATSYDVGPYTFAQTAGISNARGRQLLERYHADHPALRTHFKKIREHLRKDNTLRNLFGRPRRFYGFRDSTLYRSAYDYCPQSTTGEICNRAIRDLYYNTPEWFLLLMQIHDSLLIQVPDDIDKIVAACQQYLEHAMHYEFTVGRYTLDIPVEFKIGYRWSKKHCVEFKSPDRTSIENAYNQLQQMGGK